MAVARVLNIQLVRVACGYIRLVGWEELGLALAGVVVLVEQDQYTAEFQVVVLQSHC